MDAAVKKHHQIIRKQLQKHNGYESATEGDSFILAFHSPVDAVCFSLRVQVGPHLADRLRTCGNVCFLMTALRSVPARV
jgi:hypothetical protein